MRRLILLRHGKAERPEPGLDDFARPLAPRGKEEAQATARLLHDLGVVPDRALVSSARRTRDTWGLLAPTLGDPPAEVDARFYLADERALLEDAAKVEDDETVLLVGHNPGLKQLAHTLMGRGPHDARARAQLAQGLPTSCALVLSSAEPFDLGVARLVAFIAPPRAERAF